MSKSMFSFFPETFFNTYMIEETDTNFFLISLVSSLHKYVMDTWKICHGVPHDWQIEYKNLQFYLEKRRSH